MTCKDPEPLASAQRAEMQSFRPVVEMKVAQEKPVAASQQEWAA